MNKIFEECLQKRRIVVFGAGIIATQYFENFGLIPEYYVDNNKNKIGEYHHNIPIYSIDKIKEDKNQILIVVAIQHYQEVFTQLDALGYVHKKDYYLHYEFLEECIFEKHKDNVYQGNNIKYPRILVDMSRLVLTNRITGIERVVKQIIKEGYKQGNCEFIAVQKVKDSLAEPIYWLKENQILQDDNDELSDYRMVCINEGDILLLLDLNMSMYETFDKIIDQVQSKKGKVISVIYDLIPIQHPQTYTKAFVQEYRNMLHYMLSTCQGIICDSRTVAEDIIEFSKQQMGIGKGIQVGWFHLGCDFTSRNNDTDKPSFNRADSKKKQNKYLMVGTIEPRKGHLTVIKAFELMWAKGSEDILCIVGRTGWMVNELMEYIYNHPEFGKKLIYMGAVSDEELNREYNTSDALIFASIAEGFGLPIIEAAQYGIPLIISGIPVFKEIAEDHAIYFEPQNSHSLVKAIEKHKQLVSENKMPSSTQIKYNTWNQAYHQLMSVVIHNKWYKTIE